MMCGAVSEFGDVCVEPADHTGGHISAADADGMVTGWGGPTLSNPVETPCPVDGCNVLSVHEAGDDSGLAHNDDGSHTLVSH